MFHWIYLILISFLIKETFPSSQGLTHLTPKIISAIKNSPELCSPLVVNLEDLELILPPFSGEYISLEINNNVTFSKPLYFTPNCKTILLRIYSNLRTPTLGSPRYDHYILVGTLQDLTSFEDQVHLTKKVRFKIGIPLGIQNAHHFVTSPQNPGSFYPVLRGEPDFSGSFRGNREIRVCSTIIPPYSEDTGGTMYQFYQAGAHLYNFTVSKWNPRIFGTGFLHRGNGSWGGVVGELVHDHCDMALAIGATPERLEVVDYASVVYQDSLVFVSRPPHVHVRWEAIIFPFQPLVWTLLILNLLSFIPILVLDLMILEESFDYWFKGILTVFGTLLEQEAKFVTHFLTTKLLVFLIIFFSLIASTGYQSNLILFLTFPKEEPFPTTFLQVHGQPDIRVQYYYIGGVGYQFFSGSKNFVHKGLLSRMELEKDPQQCVLTSVLDTNPRSICIGWERMLKFNEAKRLTISLHVDIVRRSRDHVHQTFLSSSFQKESIYIDDFEIIVQRLRDTGHANKWYSDIMRETKLSVHFRLKKESDSTEVKELSQILARLTQTELQPLNVENMRVPFVIIASGLMVGLCIFIKEFLRIEVNLLQRMSRGFKLIYQKILKFGASWAEFVDEIIQDLMEKVRNQINPSRVSFRPKE